MRSLYKGPNEGNHAQKGQYDEEDHRSGNQGGIQLGADKKYMIGVSFESDMNF